MARSFLAGQRFFDPTYEPDRAIVQSAFSSRDCKGRRSAFKVNGFALARPFCESMKLLSVAELARREVMRHRGPAAAVAARQRGR